MFTETSPEIILNDSSPTIRRTDASVTLVIPGRLLASAYPGSKDPNEHRLTIERLIIDHSIQVIINLMGEKELTRFTPYRDLMLEHAKKGSLLMMIY